jgi:hypothetical protein
MGPTIDSINIKTLMVEETAPKIKDVEYLASYNWLNEKSPIILVPGKPLFPSKPSRKLLNED